MNPRNSQHRDDSLPGPTPVLALAALCLLMLLPVTMPVPVLRELVQQRFGVSELLTSLFMSINMVGAVLAAPLAGAWSDRLGTRRPLILTALLVDAALFFVLTLDLPFPLFMTARFLEGSAHIFALSLLLALAADFGAEGRGRVMGMMGAGLTLGVALGAPIGGLLGNHDALLPLRVGSLVLFLAFALAFVVLRDQGQRSVQPSLLRVLRTTIAERGLLVPLAFAFVDRFTVGFFTTTFSLYLRRIHDLEPRDIGLRLAAFLIPFALLSYPFGRLSDRVSRTGLMCGGSILYGLGILTLNSWDPDSLPLLMLFLGVTSAVMFVPSLIMTNDLAPAGARATAMGAFNAAGSLGFIVGPLVGGLVSQVVAAERGWEAGYRSAFAVAGGAEILCVALALPFLLRLRRAGRTT